MLSNAAALLFTGGKDCMLALHHALYSGIAVQLLLTFAPENADFLSHPLPIIKLQAEALGIPHRVISLEPPYEAAYEQAIKALMDQDGIDLLIGGDMDSQGGCSNWTEDRCKAVGMRLFNPLWHRDREKLLRLLPELGFRCIFSMARKPFFSAEIVGRVFDDVLIEELLFAANRDGFDACGELGEYHTLVLDGPLFLKSVVIHKYETLETEEFFHMCIEEAVLKAKS